MFLRRRRWWKSVIRRIVLLAATVLFATLLYVVVTQNQINNPYFSTHPYFKYNLSSEPYQNSAQTCVIPRLHPFHPSIWRYLVAPNPIVCKERMPTLTFIDHFGYLKINDTALNSTSYVVTGESFINKLECYWKPVYRGGPDGSDDNTVICGKKELLKISGNPIKDDVITVWCTNFVGITVYENIHTNIRNLSMNESGKTEKKRPNILIFGIDSMSRQAFIRLLPKTYKYLTETLQMTMFSGVNKVGDNTFPNLVALLTGKRSYGPDLPNDYEYFDQWPLIWKNYSEAGYLTLWAEDYPDYAVFNYLAKGFKIPPTDYYLRPFWLALQNSRLLHMSSHMCFGNRPKHLFQIDYLKSFIQKYNINKKLKKSYFLFSFLADLSHEYQVQVASADSDFKNFFQWLKENNVLEDNILIVMSDHGHRFDPIRLTQIGRLEERLPIFAILLPETLKQSNPKAQKYLELNKGKLTTPFDIHATLVDILLHIQSNTSLGSYYDHNGHGRTIFGNIPLNRTCNDVGIPEHYCTCEPEITIPVSDIRVRAAVRALFIRINKLLRTVRDFCAELIPGSVLNAQIVRSSSDLEREKTRIRISAKAQPSGGIFEATFEVKVAGLATMPSERRTKSSLPYEARVLGDVSRINKYGNQSSCIRHDILRKYCFCITKPPKPIFKTVGRGV